MSPMQAILVDAPHAPLRLSTVPDPEAAPHGAVIEVRATGVCRSDWHAWVGHDPTVRWPHVPGHEFAGVVVAVGSEVRRFRGGERVTAPFCMGCGACDSCRGGAQNLCEREYQPGFDGWGSFAQYVAVPWADANLALLPDELGFDEAASLGCRFMTAYHGLVHRLRIEPGETLAVYGCGGVGLAAVMIAAAAGAKVIAVDVQAAKLALAASLGAAETIDATGCDPVEAVRELSRGGAEASVDALGSAITCRQSIASLRPRGRQLQLGLLLAGDANPAIPMQDVVRRELSLFGGHGMPAWRYPQMLRMIGSRRLPVERLIGERLPLSAAPEVMASMSSFTPVGVSLLRP